MAGRFIAVPAVVAMVEAAMVVAAKAWQVSGAEYAHFTAIAGFPCCR